MLNARDSNEVEFVQIRLAKNSVVKVTGYITGIEYVFNGGGSAVNVDIRDADKILENDKRIQSCCGSFSTPYFEIL